MNEPSLGAITTLQSELKFSIKLAYGVGEVARSTTSTIQNFFLLFFLTNTAGLNAALAGTVLLIGNIWDVINHPVIGWLSDRTRSRWGRRRSWMLLGAIPFGVFFLLTWVVPHFSQNSTWNQTALFWYYTIVILLFNTAFAAVALPHSALAAELTPTYGERISLISFQSAFSLGGSIFALVLAQAIFSFASPSTKYFALGSVCAVLAVLCIYLCVWGTRTAAANSPPRPNSSNVSFRSQLGLIFKNRPFLYVMGIYLCSWVTMQVTAALLPYAIVNVMQLKEQDFTQVAIAVQVTAILMMIVWNAARQWVGKRAIYFIGIPLWIVALLGIAFLQPGQVGWMYGLAVLAGVGSSTALLVPWSMLPDVIDLDELQSGQRREGIFYGLTMQFQKIGVAIALFLVGKSLDWAGFVPTAGHSTPTQPEAALLVMRLEFGPVPALVLICSLVLAYFYPITREVHAEILLKLRERHNDAD